MLKTGNLFALFEEIGLTKGSIEIETGKLNIKYAINGTGKSTIAKAIAAFCNDDAQKKAELLPFKYRGDNNKKLPAISGLDEIKTIAIFNEDYISNYLFQPDDLLKGTFDVFIKSPEYDAHMPFSGTSGRALRPENWCGVCGKYKNCCKMFMILFRSMRN